MQPGKQGLVFDDTNRRTPIRNLRGIPDQQGMLYKDSLHFLEAW